MRFISERESARLVTPKMAFDAARDALIAAASDGVVCPVVLCTDPKRGNRISVKAGMAGGVTGVKLGSFWPNNLAVGLPRHSSVILLVDAATGRVDTVIEASQANALRTAAANAVAAGELARRDARSLAVFGAGNQAFFDVCALAAVRKIRDVMVVGRAPGSAHALIERLAGVGIVAVAAGAQEACSAADMIVTVTPSREPLFDAAWVQPGTYIAAMGADGPGKQELPLALLARASLFCDLPEQSVKLGEFQSIAAEVASGDFVLTAIGSVLLGLHPGRVTDQDVTIFDSSGLALQDIVLGLHITDGQSLALAEI